MYRTIAAFALLVAVGAYPPAARAQNVDAAPSIPAAPDQAQNLNPQRAEHALVIIDRAPSNSPDHRVAPAIFHAEVSRTPQDTEIGLMFRRDLSPNNAMWFETPHGAPLAVWMKNTFIPLDIVFVSHHHISSIRPNSRPFDLTPMPSNGPVDGFLEISAGQAARLGLTPGMPISIAQQN